jgi:hypothetical protein
VDRVQRLTDAFHQGAIGNDAFRKELAKINDEQSKNEFAKAIEVIRNTRSPFDRWHADFWELEGLFQHSMLDADALSHGVAGAFRNAEAALGGGGSKAPEALLQNSKEALSLIAANQRDQDRNDPQKRVEAVLKEIKEKHEKQLEWEKRIAAAVEKLTGLKQVKF